LVGPFPGYAQRVGANADAATFFVGSILFTAGGALQTFIAFGERRSGAAGTGGVVGRHDPIRRDAVLQRDDLSGAAHIPYKLPLRPARVAAGCVRVDLLSDLGRDRLSRLGAARLAARARRCGLVGAVDQPARLHLLRDRGRRRLSRPLDRLAAQPRLGELEHRTRGATCFLTNTLATLRTGRTLKSPRLRRLHRLEVDVERDTERDVERIA
jgi:hypothetical protein